MSLSTTAISVIRPLITAGPIFLALISPKSDEFIFVFPKFKDVKISNTDNMKIILALDDIIPPWIVKINYKIIGINKQINIYSKIKIRRNK